MSDSSMPDAQILRTQCCIAGGGPAGMMLGYLMARAGIETIVLEKHADFLRDFRGDTVHPSTLQIMSELGLLDAFLGRPHDEVRQVAAEIGDTTLTIADFSHLPTAAQFLAFMPQWEFLDFLLQQGRRYPHLRVIKQAEVTGLIEENGSVAGVVANTPEGVLQVRAALTVGCDGRGSRVRECAGFQVQRLGSPIDVLWFRLPRKESDPRMVLGRLKRGSMMVTLDRGDYWQCAYVIPKGGLEALHARGLEAFQHAIAGAAAFLADRAGEIVDWDQVKLLSVEVDRLMQWSRPGVLCIGDAAHAMSPVGGVGINLAIQDAVATANLLAMKLRAGPPTGADLDAVRRRRLFPVRVVQAVQVMVHERVLVQTLAQGGQPLKAPWQVVAFSRISWLRRLAGRMIGLGARPEHIRSPDAAPIR